jgi:hypothetical protein
MAWIKLKMAIVALASLPGAERDNALTGEHNSPISARF